MRGAAARRRHGSGTRTAASYAARMSAPSSASRVGVVGEVLVDLLWRSGERQVTPVPGGSPANVAVGLHRLGRPTTLVTTWGDDPPGELVRAHLASTGVDVVRATSPAGRTTLAMAYLDRNGSASYDFLAAWDPDRLPLPADTTIRQKLSPDGTTLAFVSSRSGNADIWLLDLRTRQMRNVTSHAAARPLRFTKFHARFGFAFGPGSIRRARARLNVPITAEGQIGQMKEDRPGPAIAADHKGARIVAKQGGGTPPKWMNAPAIPARQSSWRSLRNRADKGAAGITQDRNQQENAHGRCPRSDTRFWPKSICSWSPGGVSTRPVASCATCRSRRRSATAPPLAQSSGH